MPAQKSGMPINVSFGREFADRSGCFLLGLRCAALHLAAQRRVIAGRVSARPQRLALFLGLLSGTPVRFVIVSSWQAQAASGLRA
jgi:hypothetical protein